MLAAILVIVGMLVMSYPVVSTMPNNYGTTKAAEEYAKLEKSIPQEVKDTMWENAHKYNEERARGPILDPWLENIDSSNEEYAAYLAQLNETEQMGRIIIPSINCDLPIYHGTEEDTLQKGVGHLFGSDLPVGGESTHSILTGHTGLPNATLFDHLKDVKEDDFFYIQVAGHKLKYQVDQIKVVLPEDVAELKVQDGKDYVTLITCTPYGINTHRILVRGHQVPLHDDDNAVFENTMAPGLQWWMYALIAAVVLVALGLLWWLWRVMRAAKRREANDGDDNETLG